MSRTSKNKEKRTMQLMVLENPKSLIAEQYRLIRNNIYFSSVDKKIKSLVVTSPEPSDGKSTTAANLAIVFAQKGIKVLLVDADLRKPSLHFAFMVSNIDGLTSVVTKETSLQMVIVKSHVPNLDILTSGPIPPNPSELLDSNAMEILMEELKEIYDLVIFDTPPILAVSDAQILANKCDGVLLVFASGKTARDRAIKAKDLLEQAKSKLLGVIVNKIDSKNEGYYGEYSEYR